MHLQGLYIRDKKMKKENNLIFQDLGGGETKKYNGMTTEFAIFSGCKKSNHLFNIFSFNTSLTSPRELTFSRDLRSAGELF